MSSTPPERASLSRVQLLANTLRRTLAELMNTEALVRRDSHDVLLTLKEAIALGDECAAAAPDKLRDSALATAKAVHERAREAVTLRLGMETYDEEVVRVTAATAKRQVLSTIAYATELSACKAEIDAARAGVKAFATTDGTIVVSVGHGGPAPIAGGVPDFILTFTPAFTQANNAAKAAVTFADMVAGWSADMVAKQ